MTAAVLAYRRVTFARRYPERFAAAVVLLAWAALAVLSGELSGGHHHGMPGVAHGSHGSHVPAAWWAAFAAGLGWWVVMTLAMMGPVALAAARHVAVNSLRWRRQRAVAAFGLTYLGVWTLAGAGAVALATAVPSAGWWFAATVAFAALWQLTPAKRGALRACHRTVPLRPTGWPALRSCLSFGLRHGGACVASCWPLMLAMVFVTDLHLLWTAAFAVVPLVERVSERPVRSARRMAAPLLMAAAIAALAAVS